MDTKQAVEIIKKICSIYRGTLEEHMAIQQAIKAIEANIKENQNGNINQ